MGAMAMIDPVSVEDLSQPHDLNFHMRVVVVQSHGHVTQAA